MPDSTTLIIKNSICEIVQILENNLCMRNEALNNFNKLQNEIKIEAFL